MTTIPRRRCASMPPRVCDQFDPFHVFEVQHRCCSKLEVTVLDARNVTKGKASDLLDTPDPYIVLQVPGTPNGKKKTAYYKNCVNPIWDETFIFYVDAFQHERHLEVTLMDANYTKNYVIDTVMIPLSSLVSHQVTHLELVFKKKSVVNIEVLLIPEVNPDLRYSLALCDEEKNFLKNRKQHVFTALRKLLGDDLGPHNISEVPTIGLLGSGGGFRAMTCLSGCFKGLADSGILDCISYVAGLSGSSWYLSQLYAHRDFPKKGPGELEGGLKERVGRNWKRLLTASNLMHYTNIVIQKARKGQPVSFTDLFGLLLHDSILSLETHEMYLSAQKQKLEEGWCPLPLYTCLHVKKNVSERVFQEWVEFSPYEIGIAKYGVFMKSHLFGSKFFMGKIIQEFPELPLHYLQGIWGSAFTILFKRLIQERGRKDVAEMLRDQAQEEASCLAEEDQVFRNEFEDTLVSDKISDESETSEDETEELRKGEESAVQKQVKVDGKEFNGNAEGPVPGFFENLRVKSHQFLVALSTKKKGNTESTLACFVEKTQGVLDLSNENISPSPSSVSLPIVDTNAADVAIPVSHSQPKGLDKIRRKVQNKKKKTDEKAHRSIWQGITDRLLSSPLFDTRAGRAGLVYNPLRGLILNQKYPISPFAPVTNPEDETDDFKEIHEVMQTERKTLYLVDGGLTFNSPYPLLLRPQRGVRIFLSFDFSGRPSDDTPPFKELLLAEKWAQLNRIPFPPVTKQVKEYVKEHIRECYVFKDPEDPAVPTILHFVLINNCFRSFLAPGVFRTTEEERNFADFSLFSDPENPYSLFNFSYTPLQFDRLSKLMEFNTLLNVETIKAEIAAEIQRLRGKEKTPFVRLFSEKDISRLKEVYGDAANLEKLREYAKQMQDAKFNDSLN